MSWRSSASIIAMLSLIALILWFALANPRPAGTRETLDAAPRESVSAEALRSAAPPPGAIALRATAASEEPAPTALRDLVVRIVDARGAPVEDLHVVLSTELAEADARGEWQLDSSTCQPLAELPRCGRAVPAAELARAFAAARTARAAGGDARVFLRGPRELPTCSFVELLEEALPESDVELVLEGTGFLRVELLLPDSSPFAERVSIDMVASERRTSARAETAKRPPRIAWSWSKARPRARIPLGTPLHVSILPNNPRWLFHREQLDGPRREGEEVLLRLHMRSAAAISGRVFSTTGEPLREGKLHLHLQRGALEESIGASTDAHGRFRAELRSTPPYRRIDRLQIFSVPADARLISAQLLGAEPHAVLKGLEVSADDVYELGDVQLAPSAKRILAEGLVVDEEGLPIGSAFVYAWSAEPQMQRLSDATTISDPLGRFRVASAEPCAALRLVVTCQGYLDANRIRPEIGQRDVRVVLQRKP